MDELFMGLNSTGWTAIGSIITGIGISTAHMIPLFQKRGLKKRIIKIIIRELRMNEQCLQHGLEAKTSELELFKYISSREWQNYKSIAFEFFPTDVYIRTNSYYTAITRFHELVLNKLEKGGEESPVLKGRAEILKNYSIKIAQTVERQKFIVDGDSHAEIVKTDK